MAREIEIGSKAYKEIINKDRKDLALNELVFLQSLEIKELKKQVKLLWEQSRKNRKVVFGRENRS